MTAAPEALAASVSAVGPQKLTAYPVPNAGLVGLVMESTSDHPLDGATVLTAVAARRLAATLLAAAKAATP